MRALLVATCSLTLSFAATVGVNLQKLSMTKEELKPTKRPPYFQPIWCIGMAIMVLDACGDFVFIGLAPQSLLVPLGACGLGFNIILAPIFHPTERVTRNIVGATGLIYVGTILTVLFAANSAPNYNLQKLLEFCATPPFLAYTLFCVTFQMALAYHGRNGKFSLVHYCGLAGCFGGETILLAKSSSELVRNALVNQQFDDWTTSFIPYLFVAGMIVCVLTQVHLLNTGLAKFDTLVVVPVFQSFITIFGITGGLVFFQEYKGMNERDAVLYAMGIAVTLVGVTMLIRERRRKTEHSHKTDQQSSPTELSSHEMIVEEEHLRKSEEEGTIRHRRVHHSSEELGALV
ncbi:NIPA-like protein 2 [Seminavis robusta]|uniref:NIPA-like protein 2 n=1 Tax=Seminavis robusta TaxID=568900 RepID=A0A9N8E072_9STRA|nr:NIPA-like protein 2 [Seminavis robusta]|eukprot:Sro494_g154250.1 NIPA-like protein 2 (346) ;mRNA; r:27421-28458